MYNVLSLSKRDKHLNSYTSTYKIVTKYLSNRPIKGAFDLTIQKYKYIEIALQEQYLAYFNSYYITEK